MIEQPNKPADASYLSELDLSTIAEDKKYQVEILQKHPTIFFRPEDRTSPSHPTYLRVDAGGLSYIGFIEEYGSHAEKRPPRFSVDRIAVRVTGRELKKISSITDSECSHAYEELRDQVAVLQWLQRKYPSANLTPDSMVTVYSITYEPRTY